MAILDELDQDTAGLDLDSNCTLGSAPRTRLAMIFLDASAALELLLRTAGGDAVSRRIRAADETHHAPYLLDLEVAQGMVVDEAMRLHPPFWFDNRNTMHDVEMGGVTVPKGSMVALSRYSLHRHPDYWPDPNASCPSVSARTATSITRPRRAQQHACALRLRSLALPR